MIGVLTPPAQALAVSWSTANNAVLAEGQRVVIADPARFDGVAVTAPTSMCGVTPTAATSTSP